MRNVYNLDNTKKLSERIKRYYPEFQDDIFIEVINENLLNLELSERSLLIQNTLEELLPDDYLTTVDIILNSQLPCIQNNGDSSYGDFIGNPLSNIVASKGCNELHFDVAMYPLGGVFAR